MDKWLKTGTRSASRTEILTTDLAAMETTVDQQDDNHELQRSTDCPVQVDESTDVSDLSILLVITRYLNVNELEKTSYCVMLSLKDVLARTYLVPFRVISVKTKCIELSAVVFAQMVENLCLAVIKVYVVVSKQSLLV
ncbi:hypothetical protein AVEN_39596-1 [Araneus ventricosus]|uniref:Uncharacterized protein n=1 Tax=Araneus ventricosus TaxID=182803 RepID=A0A4Y2PCN1_ARAVE|nr:hypothetical protein AVEN_39596-1 [Araneus ventricosus]